MKDDVPIPAFGTIPQDYDRAYFQRAFQQLANHLGVMVAVGPVRVSAINIKDIPTSATGLRSGDIWSDSGTLKVVP